MPNTQLVTVHQLKQYKDIPFADVPMKAKVAHLTMLQANYKRLVTKLAWRTWRMLPMQVKSYVSVEDIIEEGMLKALKFSIRRYDEQKADFITGLYHSLHNHYVRTYLEWYRNEQRGVVPFEVKVEILNKRTGKVKLETVKKYRDIDVLSIQGEQERMKEEGGGSVESITPHLVFSEESILQDVSAECFVLPSIVRVYHQASPKLKRAIVAWFLKSSGNVDVKAPKSGNRFRELSHEFRELCFRYHVECDDCIHIIRSPKCLDTLSRQLIWIPYDLNNPTPTFKPTRLFT